MTQAFALLRILARADPPRGVTALARAADVNPSTAFNILRTLVFENAVTFDERTKTYALSRGLLEICGGMAARSLEQEMVGDLQRIADRTTCLVGLWQSTNGRMQLVERAVAKSPVRLDMQIHQKLPAFAGAVGRAWAAAQGLSDEKLRDGFDEIRWDGPLDGERYIAEVQMAREAGYAIDEGALHPGIVTVAAVIVDSDGTVTHGLTASDIAHRLDRERLKELGKDLRELAIRFSGFPSDNSE
ncbi:helix-turn-helix domain-containing protein [uncultured Croceicoccus sp.]|uniref:IclR family transcriptional regulator n=1 Tax=uncultured Croceicoccus sp. TaxID=1295329 RepID=UPI001923B379|nr:helix-turn-helix domain-containing protein [uncultured Croceicoccus sp.]QQN74396.1 helix-turn-helix domain-containing protein [Croceicoccus sp. YJ47]